MYKRLAGSHKLLWSRSLCVVGVFLLLWEWSAANSGTPAAADSWHSRSGELVALPQRVLLVLALPLLRLLDLHLPEAKPKHGTVLVLVHHSL